MTVYRPTYASRRDVKTALDVKLTADYNAHIDSALAQASDDIDGLCHRRFYNITTTAFFDWPNFQRAYPWRIWLDKAELADVTQTVPVVTSGGNVIDASTIFWGPWNYSPPFTRVELNRAASSSFGQGNTPQRDVAITGVFGYWNQTRTAGTLAVALTDTTGTSMTVSDSSLADVGDVLIVDSEKFLVQDNTFTSTGQTQSGSGCSTASSADNQLTVADGTKLHAGETVQLDAERMFIQSITGNVATVVRSYDGSVLATHSNATVGALRLLTVTRGDFGTTAATHLISAAITAALVPSEIKELAIAEALNTVLQKTVGYSRAIGENMKVIPGGGLPDLRQKVYRKYGRKARTRTI